MKQLTKKDIEKMEKIKLEDLIEAYELSKQKQHPFTEEDYDSLIKILQNFQKQFEEIAEIFDVLISQKKVEKKILLHLLYENFKRNPKIEDGSLSSHLHIKSKKKKKGGQK